MKTKTKTILLIHRTFYSSPSIRMADRQKSSPAAQQQSHNKQSTTTPNPPIATTFLSKLHEHAPNQYPKLMGFSIMAVILLFLTGITLTSTVFGLIFMAPVIMITSPIWIPIGALLVGFLSVGGFGASVVAGLSWLYRYLKGLHPPGSDRVDYARIRIADTASHMKDYAREYGCYLQNKVKDAAPGA